MVKNRQLDAAFDDYERLGIDPDEIMMIPQEVWAESQGLDPNDVIAYEEVDLEECKVHLMDISSGLDALHRSIKEMKSMIPGIRDYSFKKHLQAEISESYSKIRVLRAEYDKTLIELNKIKSELNSQRGR